MSSIPSSLPAPPFPRTKPSAAPAPPSYARQVVSGLTKCLFALASLMFIDKAVGALGSLIPGAHAAVQPLRGDEGASQLAVATAIGNNTLMGFGHIDSFGAGNVSMVFGSDGLDLERRITQYNCPVNAKAVVLLPSGHIAILGSLNNKNGILIVNQNQSIVKNTTFFEQAGQIFSGTAVGNTLLIAGILDNQVYVAQVNTGLLWAKKIPELIARMPLVTLQHPENLAVWGTGRFGQYLAPTTVRLENNGTTKTVFQIQVAQDERVLSAIAVDGGTLVVSKRDRALVLRKVTDSAVVSEHVYSHPDYDLSITTIIATETGPVLLGTVRHNGDSDILLLGTTGEGSVTWGRMIGGPLPDSGVGGFVTENGDIAIVANSGLNMVFMSLNQTGQMPDSELAEYGYSQRDCLLTKNSRSGSLAIQTADHSFMDAGVVRQTTANMACTQISYSEWHCDNSRNFGSPTLALPPAVHSAVISANTAVGVIQVTGTQSYQFSLSTGPGGDDNDKFIIQQNRVVAKETLVGSQTRYRVRIRAQDAYENYEERNFEIKRNTKTWSITSEPSKSREATILSSHTFKLTASREATETDFSESATGFITVGTNRTGITFSHMAEDGSKLLLSDSRNVTSLFSVRSDNTLAEKSSVRLPETGRAGIMSENNNYGFVVGKRTLYSIHLVPPEAIQWVNSTAISADITTMKRSADGNQLILGTAAGITVVNIQNPAAPFVMYSIPTPTPVQFLETRSDSPVITVATNTELSWVDQNTRSTLSRLRLEAPPKSMQQLPDDKVMVTLTNGKTLLIDASDPYNPIIETEFQAGDLNLMAVSPPFMLSAGENPGITISKDFLGNWQELTVIGHIPTSGKVTSLRISDDGLSAMFTDADGLKFIQLVQKPAPLDVPLTRLLATGSLPANTALLNEAKNWIAIGGNTLKIMRYPLAGQDILAELNTGFPIQRLLFLENTDTVLLQDTQGIKIINLFDEHNPRIIGRWNTTNEIADWTLSGGQLYLSLKQAGFRRLSLATPSNITAQNITGDFSDARGISFNDRLDTAYVARGQHGFASWHVTSGNFTKNWEINTPGIVSKVIPSPDHRFLYVADSRQLKRYNNTVVPPRLIDATEFSDSIRDLKLGYEGKAAYVVTQEGLCIIDASDMRIKERVSADESNGFFLTIRENILILCDGNLGFQIIELLKELPIFPVTRQNRFPVGIETTQAFIFFDNELGRISIDRIIEIKMIEHGEAVVCPNWVTPNLETSEIIIDPPKDRTDTELRFVITFEKDSVRQKTFYSAHVVSSLSIRGLQIRTPARSATVTLRLPHVHAIPRSVPGASIVNEVNGTTFRFIGAVDGETGCNQLLQRLRLVPLAPFVQNTVLFEQGSIEIHDDVNENELSERVRLGLFQFDTPLMMSAMPIQRIRALDSTDIAIPVNLISNRDNAPFRIFFRNLSSWMLPGTDPERPSLRVTAPLDFANSSLSVQFGVEKEGVASLTSFYSFLLSTAPIYDIVAGKLPDTSIQTSKDVIISTRGLFNNPNNNSLTYQLIDPPFLRFQDTTSEILGTASTTELSWLFFSRSYQVILQARDDKYGLSANSTFTLRVDSSFSDGVRSAAEVIGLIALAVSLFKARHFLFNLFTAHRYFHDRAPTAFKNGETYRLHSDHTQVAALLISEEWACAKKCMPVSLRMYLFGKALPNGDALPHWMEKRTNELIAKRDDMTADDKKRKIFLCIEKKRVWGLINGYEAIYRFGYRDLGATPQSSASGSSNTPTTPIATPRAALPDKKKAQQQAPRNLDDQEMQSRTSASASSRIRKLGDFSDALSSKITDPLLLASGSITRNASSPRVNPSAVVVIPRESGHADKKMRGSSRSGLSDSDSDLSQRVQVGTTTGGVKPSRRTGMVATGHTFAMQMQEMDLEAPKLSGKLTTPRTIAAPLVMVSSPANNDNHDNETDSEFERRILGHPPKTKAEAEKRGVIKEKNLHFSLAGNSDEYDL